ncbi:Retrotrans gag domain-containing protein [Abeliophyllum distichum]|uniref:Retrotrans gag domain-containing protein n=1 Tax=Abeliophyllum distichum TaxID=126358 RepID=A0ABD1SAI8_9LAMI
MSGKTKERPRMDHPDAPLQETAKEQQPPLQFATVSFNLLNEKVDEAITRRKNRGRPISIKEDPFTEELMSVPLPLKFKESASDFDGTRNPIDDIRTFQDWVRLHGWPDAIVYRALSLTLRKYAREWFNTLPPRSISSFSDLGTNLQSVFLVVLGRRR